MRLPALFFLLLAATGARSQALLDSIELHNPTLRTQRAALAAARALAGEDRRLDDPEAEVSYMGGHPHGVPARTNINVTQAFDAGVLSGTKRRAANAANARAEAEYDTQRTQVRAQARALIVDMIYYNRWLAELTERSETARRVFNMIEKKYAAGDIALPDVNKARLAATVVHADCHRARGERENVRRQLQALAPDWPVALADTTYALMPPAPTRAEVEARAAVAANAATRLAEARAEETRRQVGVAKSAAWPALTAGFAGEYASGANYTGGTLGFTMPLWGNTRARVRTAKANLAAARLAAEEAKALAAADLRREWAAADQLNNAAMDLARDLAASDNRAMLAHALDAGELSLLDYMLELEFYYTARSTYLAAEHDARAAEARVAALME